MHILHGELIASAGLSALPNELFGSRSILRRFRDCSRNMPVFEHSLHSSHITSKIYTLAALSQPPLHIRPPQSFSRYGRFTSTNIAPLQCATAHYF
jgi:hypothetical protein